MTPISSYAQRIKNPSFEGSRDRNILPFWENCGGPLSTPDIQPGNWGVVFPPDDGNTYLGLVFRIRDNGSFESITQNLNYPFHRDSSYTFEISLAFDPNYEDPNTRQPGILKIWGGNSLCATNENLWNSPIIAHKNWQTYIVSFSPKETYSSITIQGYFASHSFYNGDILIDNIRNFQACSKPKPFIGSDVVICGSQEYIIDASAVSGPFLWQDGSSNSTLKVKKSGKYWVEAYLDGCRTADTINVIFEEPLNVDLGPNIEICDSEQVVLSLNVPNASFKWNNQSTSSSLTIKESGKYWVEVSRGTCIQTDTINVLFQKCRFFVPNIITPNGDNLNDVLEIIDDSKDSWSLEIYNRLGKLLFSDEDYHSQWNGNGVSNGTYYLFLRSNTTSKTYKSTLTIVR